MYRSQIAFRRFVPVIAALAVLLSLQLAVNAHEDREVGDFELEVGFLNEPAFEAQPNGAFIKITRPTVDIMTHGALFASGTVEAEGSYEFEFGERLNDLEIPFHDHLTGESGTVTVAHGAEMSGTVMVQFDSGFSPSELAVQPGTTVMFMNTSPDAVMTVISGLHDEGDGHSHEGGAGHVSGEPVTGASAALQVEVTHVPTGEQRTMDLRPLVDDPGAYLADFIPTAPGAYTFRFFGEIDGEPFDESFTSGPNTFDEVVPSRTIQFPIELRESRELQSALEGVQSDLASTGQLADDADGAASTALIIGIIGVVLGLAGAGIGGYGLMVARRKA